MRAGLVRVAKALAGYGLSAGVFLSTATARGQEAPAGDPTPPPPPVSLRWEMPETGGCFDAPDFRRAVEQALGRDPFSPDDSSAQGLGVTIVQRDRSTVRVRLELRQGERELGSRDVDVGTTDCKRSRETVALVAAMLLEVPHEVPPPVETEAPPAPPPSREDRPPEPARKPAPKDAPLRIDLSALLGVTRGYLPRVGLGAELELWLDFPRVMALRATAGGSLGATVETPGGNVDFRAADLSVGAAPLRVLLGGRTALHAFVFGSLSAVNASATGFDLSRDAVRWIPSVGAGGALRAQPFRLPFVFSLQADFFVNLARPRFAVLDRTADSPVLELHRVSAVGFGVTAGAGVRFR